MKRLTLLVAAILLILPRAMAQNPNVITLQSAVETALDRNISIIQSRNSVSNAQSIQQQAFGNYLPDLTLNGGFSRQQSWTNTGTVYYGNVPIQGGNQFNAFNQYRGSVSTGVVLFNGFATSNNVRRAESSTLAAEHSYSRTQQSVIYQTHQLFLNVVRTFQLMKVSEENLKRSQRQLERITESNKVGAVALADVYRQQVQAGTDELALIQAQSNHEKAKADVLAFLGIDVNHEFTFDFTNIPTDIDTSEFAPLNQTYSDFGALVNSAVDRRPDYLSAAANVSGSEAAVSAAKAAYFPVVSGNASYGYSNTEFSTLPDNRSLNLGINIQLPIFNGFQTQTQIQQAQIQRQNAEELLAQNKRTVTVDIRKALLDLESSEKQIRVTQASVQSAELDRKIAEEKYNLGSGTLLDLLIANANYTQALSNKVNAVNDYLLAKKGVEFAVGTITR